MNKKGFTLVELLAVIVIMGVIMAFAFPSIDGMIDGNKRKKYEAFEKSMTEYAKIYYEDSEEIIGLTDLKNVGLTGIDKDCSGYVDPTNNYKAYLKCQEHETSGYDASKAS